MASELSRLIEDELKHKGYYVDEPEEDVEAPPVHEDEHRALIGALRVEARVKEQNAQKHLLGLKRGFCIGGGIAIVITVWIVLVVKSQGGTGSPAQIRASPPLSPGQSSGTDIFPPMSEPDSPPDTSQSVSPPADSKDWPPPSPAPPEASQASPPQQQPNVTASPPPKTSPSPPPPVPPQAANGTAPPPLAASPAPPPPAPPPPSPAVNASEPVSQPSPPGKMPPLPAPPSPAGKNQTGSEPNTGALPPSPAGTQTDTDPDDTAAYDAYTQLKPIDEGD